jgi:hypothetical protein
MATGSSTPSTTTTRRRRRRRRVTNSAPTLQTARQQSPSGGGGSVSATGGNLTAAQVIARALRMMRSGESNYSGRCQQFVRLAFGSAGGAPTAVDAWRRANDRHNGSNPPPGAAVYWADPNGGPGHAAISAGNGMVISTDVNGGIGLISIKSITQRWGKNYLGWTGDTNERRITQWNASAVKGSGVDSGSGPDSRVYRNGGKQDGYADDKQTADYGWADAVFNSNPELKKLLKKAKANDWDATTMQAAIRGTDWYRDHSASWRENWVLKRDNPGEFEQRRRTARGSVDAIANQWGVELTDQQRNQIAHDMLFLGLDEDEVVKAVGKFFKMDDTLDGQAGDIQDQVEQLAADYGVRVSDKFVAGLVRGFMDGSMTEQDIQNHITGLAKSTYSALAPQIDAGMTVREIADPYVRSMSQLLELNDAELDLYDPTIRAALTGRAPDGNPAVKPIWQFENEIRQDSRWLQTNNARDSFDRTANGILKMWGLVG